MWTGWPSAILKLLRPNDINWQTQTATVHARKKAQARGHAGASCRAGRRALGIRRRQCLGNVQSVRAPSALLRVRPCGVREFRVYDLRHLLGTTLVAHSHDERGTAELMLHTSPQQTWRYSRHAASTRASATIAAVSAAIPQTPTSAGGPRLVRRA
jgi:integrase